MDIDIQALPTQPGKAVQLELKTITPAGPGRHKVNVDLGQLWEYSQKPLSRQPFYAFPRPHWDGELAAAARADGQDATELAVQRSKTGWWFGDWMIVMAAADPCSPPGPRPLAEILAPGRGAIPAL